VNGGTIYLWCQSGFSSLRSKKVWVSSDLCLHRQSEYRTPANLALRFYKRYKATDIEEVSLLFEGGRAVAKNLPF
jgi:hypothetical protein